MDNGESGINGGMKATTNVIVRVVDRKSFLGKRLNENLWNLVEFGKNFESFFKILVHLFKNIVHLVNNLVQ